MQCVIAEAGTNKGAYIHGRNVEPSRNVEPRRPGFIDRLDLGLLSR
jgi:hypothetical protein